MRTLIFNGSPHPHGDTAALLSILRRNLAGEVVQVDAYTCGISPCRDCRWCWEHEGCAVRDGMDEVYAELGQCDAVVIASPLYFSQLTGTLLGVFSRLQMYYASRRFRGVRISLPPKRGLLILTGGGDGTHQPARDTALGLFRIMNVCQVAEVYSLHTDTVPANEDSAAADSVARAAKLLIVKPIQN